MDYNAIISVEDISADSSPIVEPVTLQEVKDYLRLEGFIDTDESPSTVLSEFDFDDNLITDLIKSSREIIEETAGLSLIRKTMQAVITNLCGMIEIPFGPIVSVTSLSDNQGNDIPSTSYTVVGNKWKFLQSPLLSNMIMVYEAGYTTIPKPIKIDIIRLIAYMYENRGDDSSIKAFSSQLARSYSRKTWIA